MTVVRVRDVGVRVRERIVPVRVGVRLRERTLVRMLVVDVMDVQMVMFHRFVRVDVGVLRAQEGSDAEHHQGRTSVVRRRRPIAEQRDGRSRPRERSDGEERALPGRAQREIGRAHV